MFINSIVQMFFMTNADEFSELIRTGGLDFALLKPIDTQFLVSLRKIEWASLANFVVAAVLMAYALPRVEGFQLTVWQVLLYPVYVVAGIGILYSLTIVLAAPSVWLGRNHVDLRFLVLHHDVFALPDGDLQRPVRRLAAVGVHVHAAGADRGERAGPDAGQAAAAEYAYLALFALVATAASLVGSRWVFQRALLSYRSASS